MKINQHNTPSVLFVTTFPPRECGIATYSDDLIKALRNKFGQSFLLSVCALESEQEVHSYPDEVRYVLNTSDSTSFVQVSGEINRDENIQIVMIQHEYGLFDAEHDPDFLLFLRNIEKTIILTFHTVLPRPDILQRLRVIKIAELCAQIVVMTQNSADILVKDYGLNYSTISVIPHGVHLVPYSDKKSLKSKYGVDGRTILSTFGLISSGKSIETTIDALPSIVNNHPDVLFLVIGKTHPTVAKHEGEIYRTTLEKKVKSMNLDHYVKFINAYLPLDELLEYLQMTDIYLFTSKDHNQAVSGTFSYAVSCGCPIISTPIPHAREVLNNDAGLLVDFENSVQLAEGVNLLLTDESLRASYSYNGLQRIESSVWENVALTYASLFQLLSGKIQLKLELPEIKLKHIQEMTDEVGIIQFAKINKPDISSGYTIDDNARALAALIMHYKKTKDAEDLRYIRIYLKFIASCQQQDGAFLNYVDENGDFTDQNQQVNLEDSNGRTIWALGFLLSESDLLPGEVSMMAERIIRQALQIVDSLCSPRAISFAIKGLYYFHTYKKSDLVRNLVTVLTERLMVSYRHEGELGWEWFESYLTYGNSMLPDAMLCAYKLTGNPIYKETAQVTFSFLISQTFQGNSIKVVSNQGWLQKGKKAAAFGEQPIDVAYTILALDNFYTVFKDIEYLNKMHIAFEWFLGNNHLNQIIYNPCTGGCYDGLEEERVNLNQGAESTVTYLMARLTVEGYREKKQALQVLAV
ncbi:glycosyltransferase [Pararcticibacter amylolyticus]|uniref:Mannosyltransferase n=1 Tax=Pararcticibacter amylolyticus TaxID=2173175 RepID=A0A2U2PIH6_9SPHI|nr:glycosyltransferase [Pararcticibacter amylolyticus]PWG81208.1 mannosyltransferase [Pararcticibacter amylolyticus]